MSRRWRGLVLGLVVFLCGWALGGQCALAQSPYDSGWVEIAPGNIMTLTHDLGGDPGLYAVDLWFRDTPTDGLGIHQRGYGGIEMDGVREGARWQNLTPSTVRIRRQPEDAACGEVRMRLWRTTPDYDSGWLDAVADDELLLYHNLEGDLRSYIKRLKFRDTDGPLGINAANYGGLEADGQTYGAAYQYVSVYTAEILRMANDTGADQVRFTIEADPDPPTYDSGWVALDPGEVLTFTHHLGGVVDDYHVRMDARSIAYGYNCRGYGGTDDAAGQLLGVHWQNLDGQQVCVARWPDDVYAEEVRVRIWAGETACVPELLYPAEGEEVDNGRSDFTEPKIWNFGWGACEGAAHYHLYVIGPGSLYPSVDSSDLTTTTYTLTNFGYVADSNREGWTWKACAEVDGVWGPWSPTRTFDIEPANTDPRPFRHGLPVILKGE